MPAMITRPKPRAIPPAKDAPSNEGSLFLAGGLWGAGVPMAVVGSSGAVVVSLPAGAIVVVKLSGSSVVSLPGATVVVSFPGSTVVVLVSFESKPSKSTSKSSRPVLEKKYRTDLHYFW